MAALQNVRSDGRQRTGGQAGGGQRQMGEPLEADREDVAKDRRRGGAAGGSHDDARCEE